jgi:hypothetical protein
MVLSISRLVLLPLTFRRSRPVESVRYYAITLGWILLWRSLAVCMLDASQFLSECRIARWLG